MSFNASSYRIHKTHDHQQNDEPKGLGTHRPALDGTNNLC